MNVDLNAISKKLKKELDEDRYIHTLGVMYTAAAMAMAFGTDIKMAQTAGLLHDCAKCIPNDKKIRLCEKHNIEISEIERKAPFLLHAKLGAYMAKKEYGIENEEILSAIRWHTTARPGMTLLEQIIFLADYIEPGRYKAKHLDQVRQLAFRDLDECTYEVLKDTLEFLKDNPKTLDCTTKEAFEYYEKIHLKKEKQEETDDK